jgi:hypothetical protein
VSINDDVFTVFISHKHDDHALAVEVKKAMEGLSPGLIDCFVSGIDITAGMDWRREIRSVLAATSWCCSSPHRIINGENRGARENDDS